MLRAGSGRRTITQAMADFLMKLRAGWLGRPAHTLGSRPADGHEVGQSLPMRTRFILIDTSHAGNEETLQRASGANDVLAKARVVDTLDEALEGMTHLCATAMTPRDFGPPTRQPREHLASLARGEHAVAFLFGSERFGMKNEDVYRCHVALSIPTHPQFGSLNLGAAIQVIAYEWRMALGGFDVHSATTTAAAADAQQIAGMLAHWEQALSDIGFLDPAAPKKLMPRLNQLFNRAGLQQEEIHILRGVAKAMTEAAKGKR